MNEQKRNTTLTQNTMLHRLVTRGTVVTPQTVRSRLADDMRRIAEWRRVGASHHPKDLRFTRCADALDLGADEIDILPDDDARLQRLARLYSCGYGDTYDLDKANCIMSRHGADSPNATTDDLMTSLVEAAEMAMAAFDAVKETAAEAEAEATAAVHGLLKSATCEGWPEVDFCREIAEGLYDVGLAVATEALVRSRALYLVGDDGGRGPHSLSGRAHNITCRALAAFYLEVGARN